MGKTIAVFVAQVASFASIASLYFSFVPITENRSPWHWLILGAWVAFTLVSIWIDIAAYLRTRPKGFSDPLKINAYMCRWLSNGGRAVIFSRDMSWADGSEVQQVLMDKARRAELTICLARSIPLSDQLRDAGAEILTYGHLNYVPRTRFTIVDFERQGARVAVGLNQDGKHVIKEYWNGTDPFFLLSEDLVRLVMTLRRNAQQNVR